MEGKQELPGLSYQRHKIRAPGRKVLFKTYLVLCSRRIPRERETRKAAFRLLPINREAWGDSGGRAGMALEAAH